MNLQTSGQIMMTNQMTRQTRTKTRIARMFLWMLLSTSVAFGQTQQCSLHSDRAMGINRGVVVPIAGATILVCPDLWQNNTPVCDAAHAVTTSIYSDKGCVNKILGSKVTSDISGNFQWYGQPGFYYESVSAPGYVTYAQNVTLPLLYNSIQTSVLFGSIQLRGSVSNNYTHLQALNTTTWSVTNGGTSIFQADNLKSLGTLSSNGNATVGGTLSVTGGISIGSTSVIGSDAKVSLSSLPSAKRVCEIPIRGTGTAGVLLDTDHEASRCFNGFGVTETITSVSCWADAGTPTVLPIITGGSSTSILSSSLTCGTGSYTTADGLGGRPFVEGYPLITPGLSIDDKVATAGGSAHKVVIAITLTRSQ